MKIIIADTSPLYVQGVELVLGKTGITVDTIVVDSFQALAQAIASESGSVMAVVDSRLAGLGELEALAELKVSEDIRLLMLTDVMDIALMRRARMLGIEGVVAKTAPLEELGEAKPSVRCLFRPIILVRRCYGKYKIISWSSSTKVNLEKENAWDTRLMDG